MSYDSKLLKILKLDTNVKYYDKYILRTIWKLGKNINYITKTYDNTELEELFNTVFSNKKTFIYNDIKFFLEKYKSNASTEPCITITKLVVTI